MSVAVGDVEITLSNAQDKGHVVDTLLTFNDDETDLDVESILGADVETDLDVESILGAEDHDGGVATSALDPDEQPEEEEKEEGEDEQEEQDEEKAQEGDFKQIKGVRQAVLPAEAQAGIVAFHNCVEGTGTCLLATAMVAHATANKGNESPVAHCGCEVGSSIRRKPTPGVLPFPPNKIAAMTPAVPPGTPSTPRREPPARCVKRRVFGAVARDPAADANADAEEVQSTLPKPPSAHFPQGHEDMSDTSNKVSRIGTPMEQFQPARPPSIARSYAALGAELHRLDGASDSESLLPLSRRERRSLPVNQRVKAYTDAYTKSPLAHNLRPLASCSRSSPRARSAKHNAILAADRLQLVNCIGGAVTDMKRPASPVPMSARPGRAAESQLPAIHVPLSARQVNLEKQPALRSSLLVKESTNHADVLLTKFQPG